MTVESPAASGPSCGASETRRIPAVGLGTWQVSTSPPMRRRRRRPRRPEGLRRAGRSRGRQLPMYGSSESVTGELAAALGVKAKTFRRNQGLDQGRQAGIRQMEDSTRTFAWSVST